MDALKYKSLPFEYKLARFGLRLHKLYSYLGELCSRVQKHRTITHELAATDGYQLFLNEVEMSQLSEEQFNFVMVHELVHIVLRHQYGKNIPFYAKMYHNIAFDLIANYIIRCISTELRRGGLPVAPLGDSFYSLDDLSKDSSSLVANNLVGQAIQQGILSDNPPLTVKLKWRNYDMEVPNSNSFAFDVVSPGGEGEEFAGADAQELLETCGKLAGNAGLPRPLQEMLDATQSYRLPWDVILERLLESIVNNDELSFCPPDKRYIYADMLVPGETDIDTVLNDALVVIDVSSSVDKQQFADQVWRVSTLLEDTGLEGHMIAFATNVCHEIKVYDKEALKEFLTDLKVGGGTEWGNVVRYIKGHPRHFRVVIVFTDGFFWTFEECPTEAIFIVQDDYPQELDSLGEVIKI